MSRINFLILVFFEPAFLWIIYTLKIFCKPINPSDRLERICKSSPIFSFIDSSVKIHLILEEDFAFICIFIISYLDSNIYF